MTRALLLVVLLAAAACDTPTSPTREIPNAIPQVAGNYRGELVVTVEDAPGHRPMRGTADMQAIVFQSGWQVTLNATITWPGELPETVWDGRTGTVDRDGVWHGNPRRRAVDPECGRVEYRQRLIRFRTRALVYRQQADTEDCGEFDWRATLARQ